jgi:hypothetical protein
MRQPFYEILKKINESQTKEQKIEVIKSAPHNFRQFLKLAFDPNIEFYPKAFPKEYKTPDTFPGISISDLNAEIRRLYLFERGNPTADSLSEEKRTILLLQVLESFEPEEATVLMNMFNKNLKIKGLNYKLVKEVYPELLP